MMLWDLPSSEGCDENGDDGGLSFCILTQIYKTSKKLIKQASKIIVTGYYRRHTRVVK
jgi:hypothetical protein